MIYQHRIAYLPFPAAKIADNQDFLDRISADGGWEPFAATAITTKQRVGTKTQPRLDQLVYFRRPYQAPPPPEPEPPKAIEPPEEKPYYPSYFDDQGREILR